MKSFLLTVLLFSLPAFSAEFKCPILTGSYSPEKGSVWASYTTYEITQKSCTRLTVTKLLHEVGHVYSPITIEMIVDGTRHTEDETGIYWMNAWDKGRLVREPWNTETGGDLLGDRSYWFLNNKATALVIQIVDDSGSVLSEEVLQKQ